MDVSKLPAKILNEVVTKAQLDDCQLITSWATPIFRTEDWAARKRYVISNMGRRQDAYDKKQKWSKKCWLRYEKNLAKYMPIFDVEEVEATWTMSALHLKMFLDFVLFPPYSAN